MLTAKVKGLEASKCRNETCNITRTHWHAVQSKIAGQSQ